MSSDRIVIVGIDGGTHVGASLFRGRLAGAQAAIVDACMTPTRPSSGGAVQLVDS
jgi:hypothetical protein